jgi:hypothetical protein
MSIRYDENTKARARCADQLDRRRGYARPAVGSRPRSWENMVAVNAEALVRLMGLDQRVFTGIFVLEREADRRAAGR